MVLHLTYVERLWGNFSFNDVTKDVAFYTTTSRFATWLGAFSQERQRLWLPKDDIRDSSSWSSTPLLLLHDLHVDLLTQYDCKEFCESSQSQVNVGLVLDRDPTMMSLSRRRMILSHFHSLTTSLRFPLCGMRALPPMLTLLSSPHSIRLPNRSLSTGSLSLTSNLCLGVVWHWTVKPTLTLQKHILTHHTRKHLVY